MDGQTEEVVETEPVAEEPVPEVEKRVLTREDLVPIKQHPRATVPRELVDVPEWGDGAQVWVFGVSETERQLADQYAAPDGKRDITRYMEAMIAASLRDSGDDSAQPLFDVPGPDNGKLPAMGWALFQRLFSEVMQRDLGGKLAEQVMSALADFRKAEETPS